MEKLILPALHLTVLIAFLTYKTKAPFLAFVSNRHLSVVEGLNRSKTQAAKAEEKKREIDAKLASIDLEKQKIVKEWQEREVVQTRAIEEGSKKILEQMKLEAAKNRAALEEAFHSETVRTIGKLVLQMALQKIIQGLSPEVHQRLNQQFASELPSAQTAVAS